MNSTFKFPGWNTGAKASKMKDSGEVAEIDDSEMEDKKNNFPDWVIYMWKDRKPSKSIIPIGKVSQILRKVRSNEACFDPQVVSLGPYHHEKPHLKRLEKYKHMAMWRYTNCDNDITKADPFYDALIGVVDEVKSCYEEKIEISNQDLAWMMLIDGCFVLEFMSEVLNGENKLLGEYGKSLVARDMMLLENQLPFLVLKTLTETKEAVAGKGKQADISVDPFPFDGEPSTCMEQLNSPLKPSTCMGQLNWSPVIKQAIEQLKPSTCMGQLKPRTSMEQLKPSTCMEQLKPLTSMEQLESLTSMEQLEPLTSMEQPLTCMEQLEPLPVIKQGDRQLLTIINLFTDSLTAYPRLYSGKGEKKSSGQGDHASEDAGKTRDSGGGGEVIEPVHLLDSFRSKLLGEESKHTLEDTKSAGCSWDSFRSKLLGKKSKQKLEDTKSARRSWYSFRSATELKAAGIKFRRSETTRLSDVKFKSHYFRGELSLPPIVVDDSTKHKFLNSIAYELCKDERNGYGVSSYICLMDSLIDREEDVKELRSEGIVLNSLGSDQDVAQLFNVLATNVTLDSQAYVEVKREIEKHCKGRWNVYMANLYYTHFDTPWTVIATIAAVFLLILTVVQTYFTIYPTGN